MSKRVHFDQSFYAFDASGNQVAVYEAGHDYPVSSETLHYVGAGAAHVVEFVDLIEPVESAPVSDAVGALYIQPE